MAKIKFRQGASFEEYCPFPVGTCLFCLYDPNAVWPGTTWHRHGEGHYLVSAGDTYKVNNTYGSNTHVLTIDEMPSHHHQLLAVEDGGNVATWGWEWHTPSPPSSRWQDGGIANTGGAARRTTTCRLGSPCTCGSAPRSIFGRWSAWLTCPSSNGATEHPFSSSARSRWEGFTSAHPTSRRPLSGRGRLGRASLRAPSSCRAEARRPAITPSARPEALPPSRCRQTLCRKSICNRSSATIAAEQTLGALRANTVMSGGKIRTFGSPEGTSRMRTGPRTFPSICGGAPRDLCGAMPL